MGGVFQTSAHGCPPSRSGLRNNPGRAAHQMEIDFYLINQWRNILLHLTGTFCGKGVLQTAGKSWVLASLLLGQWKITKEARLPSASWLPGNLLPRSFLGPGKREEKPEPELSLYLPGAERSRGGGGGGGGRGQRGRGPTLADVLAAVRHLGAGLPGLPVCHLQEWARAPERSQCGIWEPKRDHPDARTPPQT